MYLHKQTTLYAPIDGRSIQWRPEALGLQALIMPHGNLNELTGSRLYTHHNRAQQFTGMSHVHSSETSLTMATRESCEKQHKVKQMWKPNWFGNILVQTIAPSLFYGIQSTIKTFSFVESENCCLIEPCFCARLELYCPMEI